MKRIAVDINGVLRNTIEKFEFVYQKYLIDRDEDFHGLTYKLDLSGNTEQIDNSEQFEYKKSSEVNSLDLFNHFSFPNREEFFSFLYEEYAMEIFGHAPSTEMTTFNIFNELYYNLRNENSILIISNEIGKSKPASLFFLSKFGCLVERVLFYSDVTKKNMWDEIDILLTADPSLLLDIPKNKIVVKYNTCYNNEINTELQINSLSEFDSILKKIL